jgi:hypothetical protein
MCRLPFVQFRRYIQSVEPRSRQYCRTISKTSSDRCHDWNSNDEFFQFTRGRFVVAEKENLRQRETRFDLNKLASVAASAVGATQCVSIKKYPDGMFNKAYLMFMENGREVVAKVPNPNAGTPHFTTASEVATMGFVC